MIAFPDTAASTVLIKSVGLSHNKLVLDRSSTFLVSIALVTLEKDIRCRCSKKMRICGLWRFCYSSFCWRHRKCRFRDFHSRHGKIPNIPLLYFFTSNVVVPVRVPSVFETTAAGPVDTEHASSSWYRKFCEYCVRLEWPISQRFQLNNTFVCFGQVPANFTDEIHRHYHFSLLVAAGILLKSYRCNCDKKHSA